MQIFIVVKYTDYEIIDPLTGEDSDTATTEILSAYSKKQDAKFESKYLNTHRASDNVTYDVETTELY